MSKVEQFLPSAKLSRKQAAQIEVGHTTVAPATAHALATVFLAMIFAVPIIEWTSVRALQAGGVATAWSRLSSLPSEMRAAVSPSAPGTWRLVVSMNRIVLAGLSDFERALEDESRLGRTLRRPAQVVMTGWLGVGNERVHRGRRGWLFYRADVEYVTGRGFLDPARLRRRVAGAAEWDAPPQPDPRLAIAQFKRDLEARGITLIVMPTPLKPSIHADMLAERYGRARGVLQNPSYGEFIDELTRAGVLVFDPSEALADASRRGPQYLATDTHWRPESMELVAARLASFIEAHVMLPRAADRGYRIERLEVHNTGDTVRMLDLPEDNPLYPPEVVWLRRVLQADGSVWRSLRNADVLLLGDSFSNVYALESMGWGTSAGLAEQLSDTLRRPVDRLVQNDQGAFATRAMLQHDPDRLTGKRVVVYQFATRELAFGDWQTIPLP